MSNQEIGWTIAIIMLIILFLPMIIYRIYICYKERKTQNIFGVKKNKKDKENEDINKNTNYVNNNQENYKKQYNKILPYRLKNSVMTKYEKVMFNILKDYCNKNNYVLLSKVRIADFIDPIYPKYTRDYLISFNKISAKHVDFLICDTADIYPIVAIELDDYTHQRADRQQRDEFVNNVYYSAGLKILHIYSIDEESTINLLNQEIKKV